MGRHRTLDPMTPEEFRRQGHALIDTVLDRQSVLRFCIGGRATERGHVEAAWQLLQDLA
jgi:hypothetical protein